MELNLKKEEIDYQQLFMNITELEIEADKSLQMFHDFYNIYIHNNKSCNTQEIFKFLNSIEDNKKIIESS